MRLIVALNLKSSIAFPKNVLLYHPNVFLLPTIVVFLVGKKNTLPTLLTLPINRGFAALLKILIGLAKMFIAKKLFG